MELWQVNARSINLADTNYERWSTKSDTNTRGQCRNVSFATDVQMSKNKYYNGIYTNFLQSIKFVSIEHKMKCIHIEIFFRIQTCAYFFDIFLMFS